MDYAGFLDRKAQLDGNHGFSPDWMPEFLFDFQQSLVAWALHKGRGAIFADCGLGKTPMQLVWAENVRRKTGRPVLIITPLAVSEQTIEEGAKFGIEVMRSGDGTAHPGITVTNYERLHHFNAHDFSGTVCDESSAIKSFDGKHRALVTDFMRKQEYRLLCTATAAPNDYIELGTSSEALGQLDRMSMLERFFKNDQNNKTDMRRKWGGHGGAMPLWRFKGHAEQQFWRWVCSWARAMRRPSDLGFDDARFTLPSLTAQEHIIKPRSLADGWLFDLPAQGLAEERQEQRRTLAERCERVAELVRSQDTHIVWCHLNAEGDLLEKLIPQSLQVDGADSMEYREAVVLWFRGKACICSDPMFRSKLSAWSLMRVGHTIAAGSSETENGSELTSGREPLSATPPAANGMQQTAPTGRRTRKRSETTCAPTVSECGDRSGATPTASPPPTGSGSAPNAAGAVRSADVQGGSTLTTATGTGMSADSCASAATSASASSETIPNELTAPHCICGHVSGRRILISKPRIFGWGLNLQFCAHMTFFPSHSFESYYQAVRRCWRFGQKRPVTVDIVTTPGGHNVMANLKKKSDKADVMFSSLVAEMNHSLTIARAPTGFNTTTEVPAWLSLNRC